MSSFITFMTQQFWIMASLIKSKAQNADKHSHSQSKNNSLKPEVEQFHLRFPYRKLKVDLILSESLARKKLCTLQQCKNCLDKSQPFNIQSKEIKEETEGSSLVELLQFAKYQHEATVLSLRLPLLRTVELSVVAAWKVKVIKCNKSSAVDPWQPRRVWCYANCAQFDPRRFVHIGHSFIISVMPIWSKKRCQSQSNPKEREINSSSKQAQTSEWGVRNRLLLSGPTLALRTLEDRGVRNEIENGSYSSIGWSIFGRAARTKTACFWSELLCVYYTKRCLQFWGCWAKT